MTEGLFLLSPGLRFGMDVSGCGPARSLGSFEGESGELARRGADVDMRGPFDQKYSAFERLVSYFEFGVDAYDVARRLPVVLGMDGMVVWKAVGVGCAWVCCPALW